MERIMSKFRLAVASIFSAFVALMAVGSSPAAAEVVRAVEYYHQAFEHYFVTANPAEIAALDSGAFSGWWRTGQRFRVDTAPAEGLVPVCRFYTAAYAGKASHFYTASESECAHVKTMPDWTYEGVAFNVRVPDAAGNCPAGTAPISRLFNNGQGGAPNHAYTADAAKRATLVAAGWVAEGSAFCTPLAAADLLAQTQVLSGARWSFPASVPIYSGGTIQTRFYDATSSGGQDWKFAEFGIAQPQVWIYHYVNDAFNGSAAWDPLSASYVAVGNSGFEGVFATGVAWTFEDARGSSMPVCTMSVYFNLVSVEPYKRHPFQPNLWSGCESGTAYRG
jgi:hypothetical protein